MSAAPSPLRREQVSRRSSNSQTAGNCCAHAIRQCSPKSLSRQSTADRQNLPESTSAPDHHPAIFKWPGLPQTGHRLRPSDQAVTRRSQSVNATTISVRPTRTTHGIANKGRSLICRGCFSVDFKIRPEHRALTRLELGLKRSQQVKGTKFTETCPIFVRDPSFLSGSGNRRCTKSICPPDCRTHGNLLSEPGRHRSLRLKCKYERTVFRARSLNCLHPELLAQ